MSVVTELDVENALCAIFATLGWTVVDAATLDRPHRRDVFLEGPLRAALARLNPDAPETARDGALRELTRDRGAMVPVNANRELYGLLRDGVKVEALDAAKQSRTFTVRPIDWDDASRDEFVMVRQLAVAGVAGEFRPDLVGYVNGIPLAVGELKGVGVGLDTALAKNLDPYRAEIPQLFVPNAVVFLSNHLETRVGSMTGTTLEHFARWTRLTELAPRATDPVTALTAVFTPCDFLDLVENFILYEQSKTGLRKLVGQSHQRLGVNAAYARIAAYGASLKSTPPAAPSATMEDRQKLGVFWHTQGSGKSYSMALLVRKVHRKMEGDWSFVVVTDREDLDDQIHANFKATGAAEKKGLQARSAKDLKKLLVGNERVVFTLIQKFRLEEGQSAHPVVSTSPRVVVLADEAHRSQYADFAVNMRRALPRAGYMAFTGTPLVAGDETTRKHFGEYVSRYPFFAAIEDGATVPLYYDATIPDVQLDPADLDAAMDRAAKEVGLTDAQREEVEQHFSRFYILLTRSKRLDKVALHLVDHLLGFGPPMKAMVVCIDRPTTLRLAQRVEAALARRRLEVEACLDAEMSEKTRRATVQRLDELDALAWAVVVSRSQGDVDALAKQLRPSATGLVAYTEAQKAARKQLARGVSDVYRGEDPLEAELAAEAAEAATVTDAQLAADRAWVARVLPTDTDALAARFKDAKDPLRLVFVCSMWITGFDAPPCGIVYLDRPMANHTLMQTIARANRVFPGKDFGRVLDYVGVLRNLERAFEAYERELTTGDVIDRPVADLAREVKRLGDAIAHATALCQDLGITLSDLQVPDHAARLEALSDAVEQFAAAGAKRSAFRQEAARLDRLFRALGADPRRDPYAMDRQAIMTLAAALAATVDAPGDLAAVLTRLDALLDTALDADLDRPLATVESLDLTTLDLAALSQVMKDPRKHTKAAGAAAVIARSARDAAAHNPTLLGLQKRLEDAIAAYTADAQGLPAFVAEITATAAALRAQQARATTEGLSADELATWDVLLASLGDTAAKPAVRDGVKQSIRALRGLRDTVNRDWRVTDASKSRVRVMLREAIDASLTGVLDEDARLALRDVWFGRAYDAL